MNKQNKTSIILNAFLILISIAIPALALSRLPPQIPLWYSLPWGEKQLMPKLFLFVLPAISFVLFVFNLLFSQRIKLKETREEIGALQQKFLENSFIFVALSVSFINLITIIKIVGLFL